MFDHIKAIYSDFTSDSSKFREDAELISFFVKYNDQFRKHLLLACASLFETMITDRIKTFCSQHGNKLLMEFVSNQGLKRRYHTLFSWEQNGKSYNAKTFFKFFGQDFSVYASEKVIALNLEEAIHDFITIGLERNKLVHQNYVQFTSELTADEIFQKAESAYKFVDKLPRPVDPNPVGIRSKSSNVAVTKLLISFWRP